ncbi:MAG: citrate synthase [Chloroflexi bacterium]|nr:citrate synthase [Chloroflexota bacterium]
MNKQVQQKETPKVVKGLEGIYVATTEISLVDGENGRLYYRGYDIRELEANGTYEETAHLLWYGKLPNKKEYDTICKRLINYRFLPDNLLQMLHLLPQGTVPITAMRTFISALAAWDPWAEDNSRDAELENAMRLTSGIASLLAKIHRIRTRQPMVEPRLDLNHATNFLYMFHGKDPSPEAAKAMDSFLILYADHGFNASTFTARVTASTLSDMYSAITAALGALKGPLHGGAMEAAMRQFQEIGSPENVEPWFRKAMEEKRRIMGIGHRVYKTFDPRARILKERARALAEQSSEPQWFEIAEKLEQLALSHPYFQERRLYPNVDYYGALVVYYLGIPPEFYTIMFALSRVAGWAAHVIEQHADNRLIRPRALYVGPEPRPYVPLEERS